MIIEREKILDRWSEYIVKKLMDDEKKEIGVMKDNFPGPTNVDNKYTITEKVETVKMRFWKRMEESPKNTMDSKEEKPRNNNTSRYSQEKSQNSKVADE